MSFALGDGSFAVLFPLLNMRSKLGEILKPRLYNTHIRFVLTYAPIWSNFCSYKLAKQYFTTKNWPPYHPNLHSNHVKIHFQIILQIMLLRKSTTRYVNFRKKMPHDTQCRIQLIQCNSVLVNLINFL